MDGLLEGLKAAGVFLLAMLALCVLFVAIMIPMAIAESWSCSKYEQVTGRETEFAGLSCYVRDATGHMVPKDEYNARAITNERQ